MKLSQLLENTPADLANIAITGLSLDSRAAKRGDVFFAVPGTQTDGRRFMAAAAAQGAAVCYEPEGWTGELPEQAIAVKDLRAQLSKIAGRFYGEPAKQMQMIGITGTNGKTSCTYLLAQLLYFLGLAPATMGTIGNGLWGRWDKTGLTTGDPIACQRWLAQFSKAGATHTVMEVSSHALDQHRIDALPFSVVAFTNLSRDHLDYHSDMQHYGDAKKRLFSAFNAKHAVINIDDPFAKDIVHVTHANVITTGIEQNAMVRATHCQHHATGSTFQLHTPEGDGVVSTPLFGAFNIHNVLTVVGCALALGCDDAKIRTVLSKLMPAPGRLQQVKLPGKPLVMIDYAHTPDALQQALQALKQHQFGRIICVFGCGGERDQGKRPLMAQVAEQLSDKVVLTSDNPRHEDPVAIIEEIAAGFADKAPVLIEIDRQRAIAAAVQMATVDDVILIAGKGHEDYQLVGDQRLPFDDTLVARAELSAG
ncbi:MAG: UDP-N-acetylmuramoyl-L-alanyl-D-glutamate--2,6-diaminopimelate ligase [marine bacterium B5-7]|nr:MAG: UDP-N-acetylmuramoyl-L-alanyl-D-glutamate--2,6-diaminopimelate ligase [marine bacterium B5-7]